jgi:multiple sugar transport system permease protein
MATAVEAEERAEVVAAPTAARRGRTIDTGKLWVYAVCTLIGLFFIIPLLSMLSTSLKTGSTVFTDTGLIPRAPTLDNFAFLLQASGETPVFRWLMNSVVVAGIGTILSVLLTSLSAYAFARIDFRGKSLLFGLMITTLLLPGIMFLVPQYVIINYLGFYNSYPGLILPGLAGVFGVFFMRQFFLGVPVELEEAAYVDGANRFRTFYSVILPVAGPAIATLAVISFLGYWNDYLWPVIICEGDGCTLPAGLRLLQGQYTFEYGLMMAGAVLAAVPVLLFYVVAQRWIVQAVTSSGIKG